MDSMALYLALVAAIVGATLGVRTNGGGIFVVHERRLTGAFAVQYYGYLTMGAVSVTLATAVLITAYALSATGSLDWRIVLGIHCFGTAIPYGIGTWLWYRWGARSTHPLFTEVSLFHLFALAGAVNFFTNLM